MRKRFEHFLLSVLLGTSVLLVLTFWLNVKFSFNCLSATHWMELASLQASHAHIDKDFYLSIGIAIVVFIIGLYIINRPRLRKISYNTQMPTVTKPSNIEPIKHQENEQNISENKTVEQETPIITLEPENVIPQPLTNNFQPGINVARPPKLHLPKNIAQIAAAQYSQQEAKEVASKQTERFNEELAKIFTENNYVVKQNPVFGDFKTNLFAIGNNEKVWMGAVDCDIKSLQSAIKQLQGVFSETLEDIEIYISAFMIDTLSKYDSTDDITIFHNVDELKEFISKNPGDTIEDYDQENFNAYSEYIDTVITMLYNTNK